jgi:SNF2 family DNA or RNA helicase
MNTIKIIKEQGELFYEIKSDYETELMVERLVPSHKKYPLRIRVQPENTRIMRMIANEFQLEIEQTALWEKAQSEIVKIHELAMAVTTLEYVEPNSATFNGTLLPFQKQCLDFITKMRGNVLIADEMGLGKTIETISFVANNPDKLPVLVVAPLVTLINWKREIEKFLTLDGRKPEVTLVRSGKKKQLPVSDFYLINYELVDKRFKDLQEIKPKVLVYDEVHSLRNDDTKKYSACNGLSKLDSVLFRFGLSGTPIYNKGIEMYNICELIKPGSLGDRSEFMRRYCSVYWSNKTDDDAKSGLSEKLKKTVMIRRKKSDVLKDLPEKLRMRQVIDIDRDLYESEIEKLMEKINVVREELGQANNKDEEKEGLFALNKRVREMTQSERQIAGLAKAPFVVNYLNDLLDDYEEDKFVVFCHHRNVHEILLRGLYRHYPVQIIGGQSDQQRQEAIDKFQDPESDTRVLIAGLRAGNVGINLTQSAYVIFAELDWSPSIHRQAEDRLHRIGQKKNVFAHYLEGTGTFDEILSEILLTKTVEINDVLGDKMEKINNKKALEFLENKYKLKQSMLTESLIKNTVKEFMNK